MAHVLFEQTTAVVNIDPSLDPDVTAVVAVDPNLQADATAQFAVLEEQATEQTPALTVEQTLFDEPLPLPKVSEPAYLLEVRSSNGAPRLFAVRDTLDDAVRVAATVHPAIADVIIREVPLPCDVVSLTESRAWSRAPNGTWSPSLPALI